MLQAVIDIGTNTFNLIIANRLTEEILHKEKLAVRLGKGGISLGIIADDATERAIQALLKYKSTIEEFKVNNVIVTATSAVRNAQNKNEFIQKVLTETGFEVQILTGDEEANLIYQGVKHFLKIGAQPELIIDIGGGSIEFIVANKEDALWMKSLEIGGQRLMDKFHKHDPISSVDIDGLNVFLKERLAEVFEVCAKYQVNAIIGSAGSFDTLEDMYLLKVGSAAVANQSCDLPIDYFQAICTDLITKNKEERMQIPGMIAMRVDMIVVSSLLVKLLIESLGIVNLRVSAYALKEGVLFGDNDLVDSIH